MAKPDRTPQNVVTDQQLAELFGVGIEELYEPNAGMMGRYIHSVCDGVWVNDPERLGKWLFRAEASNDRP